MVQILANTPTWVLALFVDGPAGQPGKPPLLGRNWSVPSHEPMRSSRQSALTQLHEQRLN
jgi:hypothetical protein